MAILGPFLAIFWPTISTSFTKPEVQAIKKWPKMVLKWPHFFSLVSNKSLPTFVGTAPIAAVSDPTGIAAVKVPSIIVWENCFVSFWDDIVDRFVRPCGPNLNDIVIFGQKLFHSSLCHSIGPENGRHSFPLISLCHQPKVHGVIQEFSTLKICTAN